MKADTRRGSAPSIIKTLLAALSVAAGASTSHAAAPSIDAFAAQVDYRQPSLSSDGKLIVYTGRAGNSRAIIVFNIETGTQKAILAAEEDRFQVRWCRFKTERRILCGLSGIDFIGADPFPISRLIAINADGTGLRTMVQNGRNTRSRYQDQVFDWRVNDPRHVYLQLSPPGRESPFPDVYSLDVESGTLTTVLKQRTPIRAWYTDQNGVVRYGAGCDDKKRCEYVVRDTAAAEWRLLQRWEAFDDKDDMSVLGFGPAGNKLLVTQPYQGRDAIYLYDLDEKVDKELVFDHPEVDVDTVWTWPRTDRVAGFVYTTDRERHEMFDPEVAGLFAVIDKSLPNAVNDIIDSARNDKLLLIASGTDVLPRQYYLFDREEKKLRRLGGISSPLGQTPLAPMKFLKIPAKDGTLLPAYLTVPPGTEGKNLPFVVYPHGGPHARDSWDYDAVVQFMVSRGYGVLQVNFRGSTGYGGDWYDAGLRKWGTVMVDDVNAATHWAIAQGIADPRRTCIVGWSFGGYAALMGALREPELYRCVASIAGVADLRTLSFQEKRFYGGANAADYTLGTDAEELAANSPLKATGKMQAPVLLVHGELDYVVDVEQSKIMNRALKSNDKERELVLIPDADHSLSRYAWRKVLYEKLEAFLAQGTK